MNSTSGEGDVSSNYWSYFVDSMQQNMMTMFNNEMKSPKTYASFAFSLFFAAVIVSLLGLTLNTWTNLLPWAKHKSAPVALKDDASIDLGKALVSTNTLVQRKFYDKHFPENKNRLNFLPDTQEIQVFDDYEPFMKIPENQTLNKKPLVPSNENNEETTRALHMALQMKDAGKTDKALKLFKHAMALNPLHPDVLNHYGEFLEEQNKDIIKADHLYTRALILSPQHSKAMLNRQRTLPVVEELDEKQLNRIDKKRDYLIQIPESDPSLKRVKKEAYFQHIHHTVAIEGNTMTLSETRMVVETRMAVPGKSILEHNEILGLESALKYINSTLVSKVGEIFVSDILQIHRRVLGHVDPLEAGMFRRSQVYVGEHTPPPASELNDLMEEMVDWLNSEDIYSLHPVKYAALAHYKLVQIHPFTDGNGRTGRLLMNLILMRAGYPPVIIRKQDRAIYYEFLQLANEGDIRPFVRFIAQCTERTLDVYLYATEYGMAGIRALEGHDNDSNVKIIEM